uniref:Macrophage-expressed gene 1 protein n=1 Tax=Panagrolaimus sp. ES5 TaxID=591445 RepID=A0AC34GPG6_9BILA
MFISFLIGIGIIISLSPTTTFAINIDRLSPEHKCYANIRKEIKGNNISRSLGGIVGIGWDDLSNTATLSIFSQTFDKCETDNDIMFLIPDNVVVFPIKEANIKRTTKMFETFSSYKSSIGGSIQVSAGGGFDGISASGSFSTEVQHGKENMEKLSRTGFVNKYEYHAFDLIGNEKVGFDKVFADRLKDVVDALKAGNLLLAQYEAESIIGDYGTHVTNKALAGAKVSILGFATCKDVTEKTSFSSKMTEEFNADFLGAAKVGEKGSITEKNSNEHSFKTANSEIHVISKGGADIKALLDNPGNKLGLDSVVGLNREGIPIHSLIHEGALKDHYDATTVGILKDLMYNATQEYYRHNTIRGCTDPTKLNYFFKANIEDGSCVTFASKPTTDIDPGIIAMYNATLARVSAAAAGHVGPVTIFRPVLENSWTDILNPWAILVRMEDAEKAAARATARAAAARQARAREAEARVVETKKAILSDIAAREQILLSSLHDYENATAIRRTIGGVFQQCDYLSSHSKVEQNHGSGNECEKYSHRNQLTNDYSCPEFFMMQNAGSFYQTLKHRVHTVKDENCTNTICYKNYTITDLLKVSAYWCSHIQSDAANTYLEKLEDKVVYSGEGMIFGGIFLNDNIFSDNRRCEEGFQEYPFFHNLKICLALPSDFTVKKSVVFGGMISCNDIDQECPKFHSKYLATTIDGCPYYYCATVSEANNDALTTFPSIKQPPYVDRDLAMSKTRYHYKLEKYEKLEDEENEDVST